MTNYAEKFAREMMIDCLAEIARKYETRFLNATACVNAVAMAIKTGREDLLIGFLRAFEESCQPTNGNGAGKTLEGIDSKNPGR